MDEEGIYIAVGAAAALAVLLIFAKVRSSLSGVDTATLTKREYLAGFLAIVLGAPLVYMFAAAVADGQVRVHEAPFRAIIGPQAYDAVASGDSPTNYVGNDRLAPDFTVQDRNGAAWRLSDHRGKVVVMNFWTKTCRPCLEEMPSLIDLASRFRDRDDVVLVAVTTDENWASIEPIFRNHADMDLQILFDPESEVVNGKFGTRLFPETWFIDAEGVIRLRVDGPRDWSQPVVDELVSAISS